MNLRSKSWLFWLDAAVKAALVGLLLFAVARPDLEQFSGKAMNARALFYRISAVVVPIGWWLVRRRGVALPIPMCSIFWSCSRC